MTGGSFWFGLPTFTPFAICFPIVSTAFGLVLPREQATNTESSCNQRSRWVCKHEVWWQRTEPPLHIYFLWRTKQSIALIKFFKMSISFLRDPTEHFLSVSNVLTKMECQRDFFFQPWVILQSKITSSMVIPANQGPDSNPFWDWWLHILETQDVFTCFPQTNFGFNSCSISIAPNH